MIFAIGTCKSNRAAFTLIELILVMVMMVVTMAVVFPSLKGFFHGRNLDNEARQFLSLTHYGQSRAIAEGLPVELWIDPKADSYGLQSLGGYTETDTNPMVYTAAQGVQIAFSAPPSLLTRSNYWTQATPFAGGQVKIRFQPDGFISDTSPEDIFFRPTEGGAEIWVVEKPTHRGYEVQYGHTTTARR